MTNSAPPAAAINKNTATIATGSSSTTNSTPPASTNNASSVLSLNSSQIASENSLRTGRNLALQARCDAGETGVPSDESLIPLPRPVTPPNNNENLTRLLAAFSQFSPATQSKVKTLINGPPSSVALPPTLPRILFSSSSEQPISGSSSDFGFGTHPFIIQLAQNAIHIPLVLFTSKLTNKLHKESTSIKQNTVYNSLGTKCHVMDLSQFPEESTMDIADWHEA